MVMSTCVSTKKCYATSLVFRKFRCMVRYLDEGFFEKHFCCSNVLPNFITFRTEAQFQSAWPIALVMSGPSFMHRIKIPIEMEVRQKTDPGDFRQKIVPGQPGLKMKHEKTDELPWNYLQMSPAASCLLICLWWTTYFFVILFMQQITVESSTINKGRPWQIETLCGWFCFLIF